jgi:hypothetical protein
MNNFFKKELFVFSQYQILSKSLKMASKKKNNAFWWGLIFGIIIGSGAVYLYKNYNGTDFDKKTRKIERKAKKEIEKAEDEVKKLFD